MFHIFYTKSKTKILNIISSLLIIMYAPLEIHIDISCCIPISDTILPISNIEMIIIESPVIIVHGQLFPDSPFEVLVPNQLQQLQRGPQHTPDTLSRGLLCKRKDLPYLQR